MPKMTDIVVVKQKEQPTLAIRTRTKVEDLPGVIGESYGRIAQYLQQLGEIPADVPFVGYYNLDMQDLDVEIGFPVAAVLPNSGDIKASRIPEGYAAFSLFRGPYADMAPLYEEMTAWINQNGYRATGTVYEQYYNGPGWPESELLTKIVMLVEKK